MGRDRSTAGGASTFLSKRQTHVTSRQVRSIDLALSCTHARHGVLILTAIALCNSAISEPYHWQQGQGFGGAAL